MYMRLAPDGRQQLRPEAQPFLERISTSCSKLGSVKLPPYIALCDVEKLRSMWIVDLQVLPTLAVTLSLMRVDVSTGP